MVALSYVVLLVALGVQAWLMWRLDSKMGLAKCGCLAGVITFICCMAFFMVYRFGLGLEQSWSAQLGASLFIGNWLAYRGFAFPHSKEPDFNRYDVYSWLFCIGIIAFFYVTS